MFVLAISTLATAWWRFDNDAGAGPTLFGPMDAWFGEKTQPAPRSLPPRASVPETARGGTTGGATSSVGTTGRGTTGSGNDRIGNAVDGNPTTFAVAPRQSVTRDTRATRTPGSQTAVKPKPEAEPCEPRQQATQKPADTQQTPPASGAPPCDEPRVQESSAAAGRPEGQPPAR